MDEETIILCDQILKVFPKFFDDFLGWKYGNGKDAGKDFKRIYNIAKKIKTKHKHND